MKRGQAAVEFLVTYGWAILIILIAVSVLGYFDFLNPDRYTSQYCDTGPQIVCIEHFMDTGGTYSLVLRNNHNVDIRIDEITVIVDEDEGSISPFRQLQRGDSANFTVDLGAVQYTRGLNKQADIIVNFRRSGGTNNYDTIGSAIIRVQAPLT